MRVPAQISQFAALAGLFALAVSLHAGETAQAKAKVVAKKSAIVKSGAVGAGGRAVYSNGVSSGPLPEAYRLMKSADHDYKGHRASAMRHVAEAARMIGQRVAGGGRGNESQGTSDEQLRQAQSILTGASGNLAGAPLQHVQKAIEELSVALSVR